MLWKGDPLVASPALTATNPFASAYDLAQQANLTVGPLAPVAAHHPRLAGVRVLANVSTQHFGPDGVSDGDHHWRVRSDLLASGRFYSEITEPATLEGQTVSTVATAEWSEGLWMESNVEMEYANAYPTSLPWFQSVFQDGWASGLRPVYDWTTNPFDIPYFDSIQYATEVGIGNKLYVRRLHPTQSGSYCGQEFTLDASTAHLHPIAAKVYDSAGRLRKATEFRDYVEIASGVWRPMQVLTTNYMNDGGAQGGSKVISSLRVDRITLLEPNSTLETLRDDDLTWQVWQN